MSMVLLDLSSGRAVLGGLREGFELGDFRGSCDGFHRQGRRNSRSVGSILQVNSEDSSDRATVHLAIRPARFADLAFRHRGRNRQPEQLRAKLNDIARRAGLIVGHRIGAGSRGLQSGYSQRRQVIHLNSRNEVRPISGQPETPLPHGAVNAAPRAVDRRRPQNHRRPRPARHSFLRGDAQPLSLGSGRNESGFIDQLSVSVDACRRQINHAARTISERIDDLWGGIKEPPRTLDRRYR